GWGSDKREGTGGSSPPACADGGRPSYRPAHMPASSTSDWKRAGSYPTSRSTPSSAATTSPEQPSRIGSFQPSETSLSSLNRVWSPPDTAPAGELQVRWR